MSSATHRLKSSRQRAGARYRRPPTADGKPLLDVWMSHGEVTAIPSDFVTVASTESCPFRHHGEPSYVFTASSPGSDPHPSGVCACWSACVTSASAKPVDPGKIIDDAVERIRQQAG